MTCPNHLPSPGKDAEEASFKSLDTEEQAPQRVCKLSLQVLSEPQECQTGGSSRRKAPHNCKSSLGCLHDGSLVLQPRGTGIEAHGQLDGRNRRTRASQTLVPAVTARRDVGLWSQVQGCHRDCPQ